MAEFSPLTTDGTTPSAEALLEQCAGLVCLYKGAQTKAQELIDLCGGGQILFWFFDPANPIPAIAFLRQGDHYLAWCAGTVNVNQWLGNVQGFLAPAPWNDGVLVHGYFKALADFFWEQGQSRLPPVAPGVRWTITGHSLGGAIAQILAVYLGQRYGTENVELLTFGQPKAFTEGLIEADLWARYVRVRVWGDPVPQVPPDRVLSWFLSIGLPSAQLSVAFGWTHYGSGWMLNSGGILTPDAGLGFWQTVPGQWLLQIVPSNHLIHNVALLLESA